MARTKSVARRPPGYTGDYKPGYVYYHGKYFPSNHVPPTWFQKQEDLGKNFYFKKGEVALKNLRRWNVHKKVTSFRNRVGEPFFQHYKKHLTRHFPHFIAPLERNVAIPTSQMRWIIRSGRNHYIKQFPVNEEALERYKAARAARNKPRIVRRVLRRPRMTFDEYMGRPPRPRVPVIPRHRITPRNVIVID